MCELTIDTTAIAANYRFIRDKVGPECVTAGVVKADAYGLGVAPVAGALHKAGCDFFFVATIDEAIELRGVIGDGPKIAMLNGFDRDHADDYAHHAVMPVLNHIGELVAYTHGAKGKRPAILHFDTGMNRLGFDAAEAQRLVDEPELIQSLDLRAIMTHFTSGEKGAGDGSTSTNVAQVRRFDSVAVHFAGVGHSLCNSFGVFNDSVLHRDMVRPGMALYGLNPTPDALNPMRPVVSLGAKVLQVRSAVKGDACGYNETYRFYEFSMLAVVSTGYSDGIHRHLSNAGVLYWRGVPCPIRGRVSMDLSIVDISDVPENERPKVGDQIEIIGPHQSADDLAQAAGTIGYEVLTSLGRRYKRRYI